MSMAKGQREYEKKFTTQKTFKFNNRTDADILQHLSKCENVLKYIKNLIREDIRKTKCMTGETMERLTIKTPQGPALKMGDTYPSEKAAREDLMRLFYVAVERLAAYEDTGLTPEEIDEWLCKSYGPLHQKIGRWFDAEKDGRLVVHGMWVESDIPDSMLSKCTVCGFRCGAYTFNFCPNCGAKMDLSEAALKKREESEK